MKIDPKIIEVLKKKIEKENLNEEIFKILENWLIQLNDGKKDINTEEKIKTILEKINV
jgi:hypothetical protein